MEFIVGLNNLPCAGSSNVNDARIVFQLVSGMVHSALNVAAHAHRRESANRSSAQKCVALRDVRDVTSKPLFGRYVL